jgi:uncharacterized protein YkwD
LALQTAHSSPLDVANRVRTHVCIPAARMPLRYSLLLERAAEHYAQGTPLQSALANAGYLAAQSAAIHLSGPETDADMERMLAARDCHTLADVKWSEFAARRRGRDTWMVFAAPVSLPARGDAADVSRTILAAVNAARIAGRRCGGRYFAPAQPLSLDPALTRAALEHSRDMAEHDSFDHRGHDGSAPAQRIARAGFGDLRTAGENIAAGAMTPGEVAQGWLESPGHCENIMDARFTRIGIAFAENLRTRSAIFWTQDFAAHR